MARSKKKEEEYDGDGEKFISLNLSGDAKRSIVAILLFVLAFLFVLGFFDVGGVLGAKLSGMVGKVFGWGKFLSPIVFVIAGITLLRKKETAVYVTKIIGIFIVFASILTLLHMLPFEADDFAKVAKSGSGGGYIGYGLAKMFVALTGKIGGVAILVALGIIGSIIAFNVSLVGLGERVSKSKRPELMQKVSLFGKKLDDDESDDDEEDSKDEDSEDDEEDDLAQEEFDDDEDEENTQMVATKKVVPHVHKKEVTQKRTSVREEGASEDWQLPPLRLLSAGGSKAKGGDVKNRAQIIQDTFENFGISMELEDIVTGPTVTQFSFHPPSGVKLTKITALSADLALALAAHPIRIEAPIPGKSLVGIEVPNKETAIVRLRNIINTDDFENPEKSLLLALGEDVNGDYVIEDLAKMPHLLVAGATGAGKSVAVNSILLSLLYKNSPEDLKMILVDPKRVELSLYNGIPHLLSDVITDNGKVLNALKWAVREMERRYKILQQVGTRDIASYNEKRLNGEMITVTGESGEMSEQEMENLPAIVIVIDEMADLMGTHGKEVEGVIVRLAQMSRAVGIHLILSTQRPSVEVITGTIKANLPTRIALRVATNIDSRTIIDMPGAEKLVGHGDMLFVGPATPTPHRLQGVYVGEDEVKKVIDFITRQARQRGAYDIDAGLVDGETIGEGTADGIIAVDFDNVATTASAIGSNNTAEDAMYEEAKALVIDAGKASSSYIMRRLHVGYSRAARLIDELEDRNIVGPADGSRPRKIIVGDVQENDFDEE